MAARGHEAGGAVLAVRRRAAGGGRLLVPNFCVRKVVGGPRCQALRASARAPDRLRVCGRRTPSAALPSRCSLRGTLHRTMLTHLVLGTHPLSFLERALRNIRRNYPRSALYPRQRRRSTLRGGAARERSRALAVATSCPTRSRSGGRASGRVGAAGGGLRVVRQISAWLRAGGAAAAVRHARHVRPRLRVPRRLGEASFAYLDRCLKWRRQMDCARILDAPPPDRARMSSTARQARSASTPTATSSSTRGSAAAASTSCCSTLTRRSSSAATSRASACAVRERQLGGARPAAVQGGVGARPRRLRDGAHEDPQPAQGQPRYSRGTTRRSPSSS